ncbi:RNA demethylase ALKBH5-like [Fagus crenata]
MTGELTQKSSESESGASDREGYMDMLKTLERHEILEVLSQGFCRQCQSILHARIHRIVNKRVREIPHSNDDIEASRRKHYRQESRRSSTQMPKPIYSSRQKGSDSSPESVNNRHNSFERSDGLSSRISSRLDNGLDDEQNEHIRVSQVVRKRDFVHVERIDGKQTNVLQGLELHTGVFNAEEQNKIVECVYGFQRKGRRGQLRERTYSEPRKWMRGKGRVTIQFGCCYNYAVDKDGNPPGIIRDEYVDPLPDLFKEMIKRMVKWNVLPASCIPNSCIVNIYDEGDCIPPHIDHHDFVRPFCTVSFLTECNILFGSNLKILSPGEFWGPVSIPLPIGSVLVLNGNGADIAKHCVPGVPARRISITFRKMDDSKLPYRFVPEPELVEINPPLDSSLAIQQKTHHDVRAAAHEHEPVRRRGSNSFHIEKDDFPPLGSASTAFNKLRVSKDRSKR